MFLVISQLHFSELYKIHRVGYRAYSVEREDENINLNDITCKSESTHGL